MVTSECDERNDATICYSTTADTLISALLVIIVIVGVPANIFSCYLFFKQRSKNCTAGCYNNALFFRRIYIVITAVDTVSCAALFPVIQALLTGRSSDMLLFRETVFCTGWYIVWIIVQQETLFLVALLSLSRLYLLKYPLKKLYAPLAGLAPLVYAALVVLALCVLPLASSYTSVIYRKELAMCWLTDQQRLDTLPTATTSPTQGATTQSTFFISPHPEDIEFMRKMLIKTLVESFFFGLPVMPILLSLVFSLYFLTREINHQQDNHKDRLVEAARTVILVTFVYVLFNLPTLAKGIYLTYLYGRSYYLLDTRDTYEEFYHFSISTYNSYGRYGWDYIWMSVYILLPVCKSAIGPALYFWRIKTFRRSIIKITIDTVHSGQGPGYRVLTLKAGKHIRRVDSSRHILNRKFVRNL